MVNLLELCENLKIEVENLKAENEALRIENAQLKELYKIEKNKQKSERNIGSQGFLGMKEVFVLKCK